MSGIDDLMAGSNDRWAHAARRAQGIADDGLGVALKIYYTRYFPADVIVLVAAGAGVGILVSGCEKGEQKQAQRQIAGKADLDPDHLEVIRAAAVQRRKGLATQLLVAPVYPLIFIPQSMNFALRGDPTAACLMAISVAVLLIGLGFLIRDFRRAGRFLARTEDVH
jgi:hypothetical protein